MYQRSYDTLMMYCRCTFVLLHFFCCSSGFIVSLQTTNTEFEYQYFERLKVTNRIMKINYITIFYLQAIVWLAMLRHVMNFINYSIFFSLLQSMFQGLTIASSKIWPLFISWLSTESGFGWLHFPLTAYFSL